MRVRTLAGFATVGVANADPLSSTLFIGTIWNAATPNSTASSSNQQALPSNPLNTSADLAASFTYQSAPTWNVTSEANNTISGFLNSNGSPGPLSIIYQTGFSGATTLSTSGFASASLFDLKFTIDQAISGTVVHDDGMSIYNSDNTVKLIDASAPTTPQSTDFNLKAGPYNLWYLEANGAPAELNFTNVKAVPEPASLALLGSGLLGLGLVMRRRRRL